MFPSRFEFSFQLWTISSSCTAQYWHHGGREWLFVDSCLVKISLFLDTYFLNRSLVVNRAALALRFVETGLPGWRLLRESPFCEPVSDCQSRV